MIVFNHDVSDVAQTHHLGAVAGVERYAGRVLGFTESSDVLFLPPSIKDDWKSIQRHYGDIGLSHTTDIIWELGYGGLADFTDQGHSVFFFSDAVHSACPAPERLLATRSMNSKNNFIRICDKFGVPTPKTQCFNSKEELRHVEMCYPLYLKEDVSASGVGVFYCRNDRELQEALVKMSGRAFQIQEEIIGDKVTFLNVQFFACNHGSAHSVEATAQLLDGFTHMGNICPVKNVPWEILQPLAEEVAKMGVRDFFAFDVAVIEKDDDISYQVIECNPRWNGATYPTVIADVNKLNVPQWSARFFKTKHRQLKDIDLTGLAFDKKTKSGVVIVNWGCVQDGKLGLMLAGSEYEQSEMLSELKYLL